VAARAGAVARPVGPILIGLLCSGCATFQFLDWSGKRPAFEAPAPDLGLHDYVGVFHVHSRHSHDSKGNLEEIVRAAQKAGAHFVVVTDHNTLQGLREGMDGLQGPTLVVVGDELSTRVGHLSVLGPREELDRDLDPAMLLQRVREESGLSFVAHGEAPRTPWKDWTLSPLSGMEVYNLAGDIYEDGRLGVLLKLLFFPPRVFFKSILDNPRRYLARWDELLRSGKVVGLGAADAHQKVRIFGRALDGYGPPFKVVQTHVWAKDLSRESVLGAIEKGHVYVGFDLVSPVSNFVFLAESGDVTAIMGDEVTLAPETRLRVFLPKPGVIHLLKDGRLLQASEGRYLEASAPEPGVYRVEVYQGQRLWVLSNPIYVQPRGPGADSPGR
jgi:hypothetical protein